MNHYKRTEYEALYLSTCKELKKKPIKKVTEFGSYFLLLSINFNLIKLGCVPFSVDELELDLV